MALKEIFKNFLFKVFIHLILIKNNPDLSWLLLMSSLLMINPICINIGKRNSL